MSSAISFGRGLLLFCLILVITGCMNQPSNNFENPWQSVPTIRLSFRFEADVPAPSNTDEEKSEGNFFPTVKDDFERNRKQDILDETIVSPDGTKVLALYHLLTDAEKQYRLDLYSSNGTLIRKITPEGLAVTRFPNTIAWSPDSKNIAFVGMLRLKTAVESPTPPQEIEQSKNSQQGLQNVAEQPDAASQQTETNSQQEENSESMPIPQPTSTPSITVFRTEQVYICNSDGENLRAVTQSEGLIHFYLAWAPNSSALVGLAATWREWEMEKLDALRKGEVFIPSGRPRIIETNGRVRLLDDRKTRVLPVWSPDSSKVAAAFDTEIRIYDAISENPTQAAIPLRNQLLIASQEYEKALNQNQQASDQQISKDVNLANTGVSTLPNEEDLVSFNPIVKLLWTEDRILYFQTGYVKEMQDAAQSVRSFMRWHKLIFSLQA
jgi:Tol biopolymer transport system component